MNISTLMLAMLVMVGIVLGCIAYYSDIIITYSPTNSTDTAKFEKLNQTFSNYSSMMTNLENKTIGFSITNPSTWGDGVLAFLSAAGIILQTPQMFNNIINSLLEFMDVPFPVWFLSIITIGITLFVIMKIVSIFLRRYGGDI